MADRVVPATTDTSAYGTNMTGMWHRRESPPPCRPGCSGRVREARPACASGWAGGRPCRAARPARRPRPMRGR